MDIRSQTYTAICELCEVAKLKSGDILVVGCSTSEVVGSKIGTNSDPDTAGEIYKGIMDALEPKGIYLAVQCCEHLREALNTVSAQRENLIRGGYLSWLL